MQIFYMITGRDVLYLYEKDGMKYNRQYIQGNPEYHYQIHTVKKDMEKLLKELAEDYNLDIDMDHVDIQKANNTEMAFVMVENADPVLTEAVSRGLGGFLSQKYVLDSLISDIIRKLCSDGQPLVKDFGVNFDGNNYRLANGVIQRNNFSLLGYTLQPDDLLQYIG